jgi:hypothetical protein
MTGSQVRVFPFGPSAVWTFAALAICVAAATRTLSLEAARLLVVVPGRRLYPRDRAESCLRRLVDFDRGRPDQRLPPAVACLTRAQKIPGATLHLTRLMYSAYSGSFASVRSS